MAWKSTNSDESQTDPKPQWDPLESAAQSKGPGFNAQKTFSNTETRTRVQLFPAKMILAANEPRLFFKKRYVLIMKISTGKINFQKAQKLTTEVHQRLICVKYEGRCCRHGTSHRNKGQFLTNTNRSSTSCSRSPVSCFSKRQKSNTILSTRAQDCSHKPSMLQLWHFRSQDTFMFLNHAHRKEKKINKRATGC